MTRLEDADLGAASIWSTAPRVEEDPVEVGPVAGRLPVRWNGIQTSDRPIVARGGVGEQVAAGEDHRQEISSDEPEPDAISRGWVVPPGGTRVDAIFVLAGTALGIGRVERVTPPVWLNLDDLVNLDAIGDPVDGLLQVEITMEDQRAIGAGWTEDFCNAVVEVLQTTAGRATATPGSPADTGAHAQTSTPLAADPFAAPTAGAVADESSPGPFAVPATAPAAQPAPSSPFAAPPAEVAPESAPASPFATPTAAPAPEPAAPTAAPAPEPAQPSPFAASPVDAVPSSAPPAPLADARVDPQGAPAPTPESSTRSFIQEQPAADPSPTLDPASTPAPVPTGGEAPAASLELEDVVYLGGYPGQSKKRKKCVVGMSRTGLDLNGPGGLNFRVGWDDVRSIEVQNSDEARFRMNTKIHRDASALVVECDQGVTILLEARDCPTIALRSAISQLLAGLSVLVV